MNKKDRIQAVADAINEAAEFNIMFGHLPTMAKAAIAAADATRPVINYRVLFDILQKENLLGRLSSYEVVVIAQHLEAALKVTE